MVIHWTAGAAWETVTLAAPGATGESAAGQFDPGAARAAAARLRSLLEASDGEATEAVDRLAGALGNKAGSPHLNALRSSVGDFDFVGALQRLGELERECGLSKEEART